MTERLKQIWSGFEGETERRLTGRGVDSIIVPNRAQLHGEEEAFLPRDFVSPASIAFEALKSKLTTKARRADARRKRRGEARGLASEPPPAPLSSDASVDNVPEGAIQLIRGLRATEARIERSDNDYLYYLSTDEGRAFAGARKRKKFFGIF